MTPMFLCAVGGLPSLSALYGPLLMILCLAVTIFQSAVFKSVPGVVFGLMVAGLTLRIILFALEVF